MVASTPTPPRLFVIRHGETEWSLSGQHTGRTDIALTARGEEGARALEPFLRDIPFARVLASPRKRAQRTCALAGLGGSVVIEPDLAEWDYGDYEGLRSAEIQKEKPGWNIFRDGCPGGESPADVSARADRLIAPPARRGRQCRGVHAWPLRARAGGAMDRAACHRRTTFRH